MVEGRAYQNNFSAIFCETVYDLQSRERKAKTIFAVLRDFLGTDFRSFSILDVGCSTEVMANHFSDYFGAVVGIDIDELDTCFLHKK